MDFEKVLGVVGLVAYLGVGFFPYLSSGLVVPAPWIFLLWALWIVGLVFAWRTFRSRPALLLLFPVAAVAFWFLYLTAGEQLFGWTP